MGRGSGGGGRKAGGGGGAAAAPAQGGGPAADFGYGEPGSAEDLAADAWGAENFRAWADSLSNDDRSLLRNYQGAGHLDINGQLRGDWGLDPETAGIVQEKIARLDAVLARGGLPVAVTGYRGVGQITQSLGVADARELIGRTIMDPGFGSFSANMAAAGRFASSTSFGGPRDIFRVRLPAGTPAGYFGSLMKSASPKIQQERELVVGRGLSYRVTGVRSVTHGGREFNVIDAEVVR